MFSDGDQNTNTIESFLAIVKRGVYGIYHSVSEKRLQKYTDEFSFRYNNRQDGFEKLLRIGHYWLMLHRRMKEVVMERAVLIESRLIPFYLRAKFHSRLPVSP